MKTEKIPTLSVAKYGLQFSVGSTEWENFRFSMVDHFHVNTIEEYIRLSQLKELPLPPHRKEVFDFIYLTRGSITRTKGLDDYEFSAGSFFFLPAYQVTAMKKMSEDAHGFYCHFNSEIFYRKLFQKELLQQFPFLHFTGNPIVEIDGKSSTFIIQLLRRLEQEYKKGESCNPDQAASLLLALFFELKPFAREIKEITDNAAYRIANEYKNLLLKHIHEKQKVGFYADMLSVSPEHLNRSVKTAFGKTAHHYLEEMLLIESKVLLKQSTLNVSEIAYKVGKENPGDFIRFFKSKTGITPRQYRLNI